MHRRQHRQPGINALKNGYGIQGWGVMLPRREGSQWRLFGILILLLRDHVV